MRQSEPQQDLTCSHDVIQAGSRIAVYNALSGLETLNWVLTQDEHMQDVSTLAISLVADMATAPRKCVRIVDMFWPEAADKQTCRLSFLWVPVDDSDSEDLLIGSTDIACFICGEVCKDADDTNSRHCNCVRCLPCFLCEQCRIFLPRSAFDDSVSQQISYDRGANQDLSQETLWPVCFWCLDIAELPIALELQIPDRTWVRMALLSDFYQWRPPAQGHTSWWDRFVVK